VSLPIHCILFNNESLPSVCNLPVTFGDLACTTL
jgi:hypothetical protein